MVSSVVEVFHLPTRKWEQKPTTDNPPLGVSYYAESSISEDTVITMNLIIVVYTVSMLIPSTGRNTSIPSLYVPLLREQSSDEALL